MQTPCRRLSILLLPIVTLFGNAVTALGFSYAFWSCPVCNDDEDAWFLWAHFHDTSEEFQQNLQVHPYDKRQAEFDDVAKKFDRCWRDYLLKESSYRSLSSEMTIDPVTNDSVSCIQFRPVANSITALVVADMNLKVACKEFKRTAGYPPPLMAVPEYALDSVDDATVTYCKELSQHQLVLHTRTGRILPNWLVETSLHTHDSATHPVAFASGYASITEVSQDCWDATSSEPLKHFSTHPSAYEFTRQIRFGRPFQIHSQSAKAHQTYGWESGSNVGMFKVTDICTQWTRFRLRAFRLKSDTLYSGPEPQSVLDATAVTVRISVPKEVPRGRDGVPEFETGEDLILEVTVTNAIGKRIGLLTENPDSPGSVYPDHYILEFYTETGAPVERCRSFRSIRTIPALLAKHSIVLPGDSWTRTLRISGWPNKAEYGLLQGVYQLEVHHIGSLRQHKRGTSSSADDVFRVGGAVSNRQMIRIKSTSLPPESDVEWGLAFRGMRAALLLDPASGSVVLDATLTPSILLQNVGKSSVQITDQIFGSEHYYLYTYSRAERSIYINTRQDSRHKDWWLIPPGGYIRLPRTGIPVVQTESDMTSHLPSDGDTLQLCPDWYQVATEIRLGNYMPFADLESDFDVPVWEGTLISGRTGLRLEESD